MYFQTVKKLNKGNSDTTADMNLSGYFGAETRRIHAIRSSSHYNTLIAIKATSIFNRAWESKSSYSPVLCFVPDSLLVCTRYIQALYIYIEMLQLKFKCQTELCITFTLEK